MTVATQIQFRRDTAANWTSTNPILGAAEIGYETDTNKFKIGDGASLWSALPSYSTKGVDNTTVTGVTGATTLSAAPYLFLTLSAAATLSFAALPTLNMTERRVLTITNGAAGITWPTGIRWIGTGAAGTTPTLSTGVDKVTIDIHNVNGTLSYDATYNGRLA